MPHPIINLDDSIPGSYSRFYRAPWTAGEWVPQGTGLTPGHLMKRTYRPASTNNRRRPDQTRPPSNWAASGLTASTGFASLTASWPGGYEEMERGNPDNPYWGLGAIPIIRPSLQVEVLHKALSQYTERSVELGAFLKEIGSTARMVGDAATDFSNGLNTLMQRNPKWGKMASWKKLPSKYLEYLYGWRNMSEDVSNAMYHLVSLRDHGFAMRFTLKSKQTVKDTQSVSSAIFSGNTFVETTFALLQKEACGLTFELPSWAIQNLPVISPFGELYEGTPYSFVLDWFLPAGNWIGAMEAVQIAPFFHEGWQSSLLQREITGCQVVHRSGGPSHYDRGSIKVAGKDYQYSRQHLLSLPYGQIFSMPGLKDPLSLSHAAQGLALLTQVFQKWS